MEEESGTKRRARIRVSNDAAARLAQIMMNAVDQRRNPKNSEENGSGHDRGHESDEQSDEMSPPHKGTWTHDAAHGSISGQDSGEDSDIRPARMPKLPQAVQHVPRDGTVASHGSEGRGWGKTSRFRRKASRGSKDAENGQLWEISTGSKQKRLTGRANETISDVSGESFETSSAQEDLSAGDDGNAPPRHLGRQPVTLAEKRLRNSHGPAFILYVPWPAY